MRKSKGRSQAWVFAALAVITLNSVAASAQQLEKVTAAAVRVSSIGSVLIAKDRGYFKDEGIDASLTYFDSGGDSILAVVSGSADIAAGALNASIFNLAAKGGMKIVAGQTAEKPGFHSTAFVVTNAAWDAGLRSPKDITGKRVGIVTTGGATHYALGLLAQKYGFKMSDVTLTALQSNTNIAAAFKGSQIDVAVVPVPLPQQFEAQHLGHILTWADDETPWQEGVVFANAKLLNTRRAVTQKYLQAYAKGCNDYDTAFNQLDASGNHIQGPGYDADMKLVSDTLGVPEKNLVGSFSYCEKGLKLNLKDIGNQLSFWQAQGAVDKSIKLEQVVDPMM